MNISGLENEIQSWIAVQSEHSCQFAGDVFVVCAEDLAEFIKNLFENENEKLEGCVVVPETLSLDLARKRAEYIYQGAKNYLAREYANLSAIEMQLFKERWIESKAVSLQTDYLLTLESARGGK
nr:hypothetical protein [uncultured Acinetobacter sp.]